MEVEPYLQFNGRAEEAAGFYRAAIGAEVEALMRFRDNPEPMPPGMLPPGTEDKVMHMSLKIGTTRVLLSDGSLMSGNSGFAGFSLTLTAADASEAQRLFTALGEGGQVKMPLAKTFFSPSFGMLEDRFGVSWIVMAAHTG